MRNLFSETEASGSSNYNIIFVKQLENCIMMATGVTFKNTFLFY